MKYIILSKEQALIVKRDYQHYPTGQPFYGLEPTIIKSGDYILPVDIFLDPLFSEAFPVIAKCEIRDVTEDELIIEEP